MNYDCIKEGFAVYLDEESEQDAYTLHKWFLDSEPETMTCRPIEIRDIDELLRRFHQRKKSGFIHTFAIRRVSDKELLGRVSYFDANQRNGAIEIGFMLNSDFHRKGYATEAVKLLLIHIFDDLGMKKVMAQTGEFNKSSVALLKKLGFKQDGCLRRHHELNGKYHDDLLFSLLSNEFAPE